MSVISRRKFVGAMAAVSATAAGHKAFGFAGTQRFKVAVITDEITQDFDHACSVASKDFGMHWVELRAMWGKSLMVLDDAQLAEVEKTLAKLLIETRRAKSQLDSWLRASGAAKMRCCSLVLMQRLLDRIFDASHQFGRM